MALFNTSVISKITFFLVAAMLSVSAMAADFSAIKALAEQGNADAQIQLGFIYDDNEDYAKAIHWYRKAAYQGSTSGQHSLAYMYEMGRGVRQDYPKAVYWYQRAADQGDPGAQYNLGLMYIRGQGVRQDLAIAKELFGKSCDTGAQISCDAYRKFNEFGF